MAVGQAENFQETTKSYSFWKEMVAKILKPYNILESLPL
jgi:hypothetical protein